MVPDFDGKRYLQRFFTRTFTLPAPPLNQFIAAEVELSGVDVAKWQGVGLNDEPLNYLSEASMQLEMGPREIKRAFEILLGLTTTWNERFPIQLSVMYPLISGYLRGERIEDWSSQSWFRSKMKSLDGWLIEERVSDSISGKPIQNLATKYSLQHFDASKIDMSEYMRQNRDVDRSFSNGDGIVAHVVYEAVVREHQARFSGRLQSGQQATVKRYPAMIKYAGHLG